VFLRRQNMLGTSMLIDCLTIIGVAVGSAFFAEGLGRYFVFSKPHYVEKKDKLIRLFRLYEQKKADAMVVKKKDKIAKSKKDTDPRKKQKKMLEGIEADLRKEMKELKALEVKANFSNGAVMIALFWVMNKMFKGVVVGRLPFQPITFIQRMTHRGLDGEDFFDCSMTFIYTLASLGLRPSIKKLIGSGADDLPRGLTQFGPLKLPDQNIYDKQD